MPKIDELRVRALEQEIERLRGVVEEAIEQVQEEAPRTHLLMTLRSGLDRYEWDAWSREGIVEAARAWRDLYGEAPGDTAWNPSQLRKRNRVDEIERYLEARWPSSASVRRHFGGFPAMLREAGIEPNPQGYRGTRTTNDEKLPDWTGWELLNGYRAQRSLTQGALAERTHLSLGFIRGLEQGRFHNPGVRSLLALSRGLGVRAAALLDE